jgi:hypothetical protein
MRVVNHGEVFEELIVESGLGDDSQGSVDWVHELDVPEFCTRDSQCAFENGSREGPRRRHERVACVGRGGAQYHRFPDSPCERIAAS